MEFSVVNCPFPDLTFLTVVDLLLQLWHWEPGNTPFHQEVEKETLVCVHQSTDSEMLLTTIIIIIDKCIIK